MKSLRHFFQSLAHRLTYREDARDFLLRQMPKHSVCAEIGIYQGCFSARIISIVEPRQLHLIDPWKYEPSSLYQESWYGGEKGIDQANMDAIYQSALQRFQMQVTSGAVRFHRTTSADASTAFVDCFFDWIYIDGNHQYEFVKNDLEMFYPKLKKGGLIAGDDYCNGYWWKGGVKRAVDEFASNGTVEVLQVKKRQFILRKK